MRTERSKQYDQTHIFLLQQMSLNKLLVSIKGRLNSKIDLKTTLLCSSYFSNTCQYRLSFYII